MKIGWMVLLFGIAIGTGAQEKAAVVAAGQPVLVELFTSEGCSSCPPADALLRELNGMVTATGQTVVVLSEHVTYWNRLGWADPFSQDLFTTRQEGYAQRLRLESAYTPQAVVNGERDVLGSDRGAMLRAIAAEAAPAAKLQIENAAMDGAGFKVTFALHGELPKHGVEIYAAVAENQTSSKVSRGENGGRTLTHVAVVRTLTRVAAMKAAGTMTVSVPAGALPAGAGKHLVLFAQEPEQGRVLGVATAAL